MARRIQATPRFQIEDLETQILVPQPRDPFRGGRSVAASQCAADRAFRMERQNQTLTRSKLNFQELTGMALTQSSIGICSASKEPLLPLAVSLLASCKQSKEGTRNAD